MCQRKLSNFIQFLCLWVKQSTIETISRINLISGEGKRKYKQMKDQIKLKERHNYTTKPELSSRRHNDTDDFSVKNAQAEL